MSEPPIPIDSRVVLKGGYEVVYPSAWAGSEGWIRKARVDEYGFDQVYVEWDKEHWRYDGELDCWTFPNHFRVIEDPVVEETPELATTPSLEKLGEEQAPCPDCGEVHPNHIEWADYFDTLTTAADKAADADNFVLMTVAPTEGDPSTLAPHPFIQAFDEEMIYRLYAQMARISAAGLQVLVDQHYPDGEKDGRQGPDDHANDHANDQERPSDEV